MATTMLGRRMEAPAVATERGRWATVRIETDGGVYVGRMFVGEVKTRVSDVLENDRQFLSLTDVRVNGTHVEAYLAVNKSFIRTLRILDEGIGSRGRMETC